MSVEPPRLSPLIRISVSSSSGRLLIGYPDIQFGSDLMQKSQFELSSLERLKKRDRSVSQSYIRLRSINTVQEVRTLHSRSY